MSKRYAERNRNSLIEQANQGSLMMLLKTKVTLDEKRELVKERNPLLFIFGDKLVAQGDRSYQEFINHLYLGD